MLDLFADFSSADPAAALAGAVDGCPFQWEPETHALYAFRARDVGRVLKSKDFWSERAPDSRIASLAEEDRERRAKLKVFFSCWPVFSDGDYHRRIRHVAIRLLRDVGTSELRGSCERLATARLTGAGERTFDWLDRIARPLAREAVVALTSDADADRLIELGGVIMNELATPRIEMERVDAALAAIEEMRDWLGRAPAAPPSPFVAGLAEVWADERFGPDAATALLTQIITGLYEPTVATLGLAAERVDRRLLATLPRRALREEVFRLATPFRFASRYARRPVSLGAHRFEAGDRITLCLGTANLDPDYYPEPLEFRKRRRSPRSFSFGAGPHYCPGAPLAQVVVGALLDTLARLGAHFVVEHAEREPELPMLRYRRLDGRLARSGAAVPRLLS